MCFGYDMRIKSESWSLSSLFFAVRGVFCSYSNALSVCLHTLSTHHSNAFTQFFRAFSSFYRFSLWHTPSLTYIHRFTSLVVLLLLLEAILLRRVYVVICCRWLCGVRWLFLFIVGSNRSAYVKGVAGVGCRYSRMHTFYTFNNYYRPKEIFRFHIHRHTRWERASVR